VYVILMGAQGSGKGTQAAVIGPQLKLDKVATGELFRAAIAEQTEFGQQLDAILKRGDLVPDDVTVGIVRDRVTNIVERVRTGNDVQGALFDGFPRTRAQAEGLDQIFADLGESLTAVIEIEVPRAALIERLAGRRTGATTGTIYNVNGLGDDEIAAIGEELIQRDDDQADAITRRLALYDEQTAPLISYYAERGLLQRVNGDQPVEDVTADILRVLGVQVER